MTKYEAALREIEDIAKAETGAYVCSYRACDGAIGVAVTPRTRADGQGARLDRSDPDYRRLHLLVASWYGDFHDEKVADRSLKDTGDGFGARLFAVELKGPYDGRGR